MPDPNIFHEHLDACAQCRNQPFNLCAEGAKLLQTAVDVPAPDDPIDAQKYPTAAMVSINSRSLNNSLRIDEAYKLARRVRLLEAKARVLDMQKICVVECCCSVSNFKRCEHCQQRDAALQDLITLEGTV